MFGRVPKIIIIKKILGGFLKKINTRVLSLFDIRFIEIWVIEGQYYLTVRNHKSFFPMAI